MEIFQVPVVTDGHIPQTNGLSWKSYSLTGLTISSTSHRRSTGNAAFQEDLTQQEAAAGEENYLIYLLKKSGNAGSRVDKVQLHFETE